MKGAGLALVELTISEIYSYTNREGCSSYSEGQIRLLLSTDKKYFYIFWGEGGLAWPWYN